MTDEELKEKYLGKRIQVPWVHPSLHMRRVDDSVTGICQNIGHNSSFPSWRLVVVIGRMPISNIDLITIKLLE